MNLRHSGLHEVFNRGVQDFQEDEVKDKDRSLVNATLVLRLLYDLAIDSYDRSQTLPVCCTVTTSCSKMGGLTSSKSNDGTIRRPLNLTPVNTLQPDPILVHPGVVLAMFQLLPSIWVPEEPQVCNYRLILIKIVINLLISFFLSFFLYFLN